VQELQHNLVALNARIRAACDASGRSPEAITLIGVSKTKPVAAVRDAARLGIHHLGENYLDEAIEKIRATAELGITWHYIGRIQSNKTRDIAKYFDWVHTIDRVKIARRLHEQCPPGKTLNVLMQINIDEDPAKGGVTATDAQVLLKDLQSFSRLRARGLMTILAQHSDPGVSYHLVAQLFSTLGGQLDGDAARYWDTLSMGMTGDLEQAIAAGATHIRVGTALFGPREP